MTKPLTIEKTHEATIAADQLVNELANRVVIEGITPLKALTLKAQEDAKEKDWQIYLSGSSFTSAVANPLHFLVNKFVKVFFGKSPNLVLGSAYHKGLEMAARFYIETGKYPRFGKALVSAIAYIKEDITKINSEERPEPKELYKEVSRLLKTYWPELEHLSPVEAEVFVQMPTPEYMLRNKENALRILLTGAADVIYKTEDGLVLSDHKTSKNPISGKCPKDEKLVSLEKELKSKKAELVKANKQIERLSESTEKLENAKKELASATTKTLEAEAAGKATTQLKKRMEKWQKEILKWKEKCDEAEAAKADSKKLMAQILEEEEILEEMYAAYNEEKAKADLNEAKHSHGQQLAFYALLYMITTGKEVKRVRLENMVKATAKPYLQVFEWELDDLVLAKAEEQIKAAVTRIELMLEGIDPLVLFPLNQYSYIGTETNKLIADIEEAAEVIRKEVNGEGH